MDNIINTQGMSSGLPRDGGGMTRFLPSFFVVCLFLLVAQLLGFSFGFDSLVLWDLFLFLLLILIILEIKKRWSVIYPIMKELVFGIRTRFLKKREEAQERIIVLTPMKFRGRKSNSVILVLAVFSVFISEFKELAFNRNIVLLVAFLGIFFDVFIFKTISDLLIIFLIGLWISSIERYQFEEKTSLIGGVTFLIFSLFFSVLKSRIIAEKLAIWAYVFLAIGVGQILLDYLKKEKSYAGLKKE